MEEVQDNRLSIQNQDYSVLKNSQEIIPAKPSEVLRAHTVDDTSIWYSVYLTHFVLYYYSFSLLTAIFSVCNILTQYFSHLSQDVVGLVDVLADIIP
jgi:hypothetical protein